MYADAGHTLYGFGRLVVSDPMGHWLRCFATIAVMVTLVYSRPYAADRDMLRGGELFSLSMFALLGMSFMISGQNFIVIYLGLELLTLSSYALVALRRDHTQATEAAMKYFVLGAMASGFLLYGMSMLYGATGSLELSAVLKAIASGQVNHQVLVFGLVFIVSGLAFKIGAVPFHMWTPDVYQGSPTPVTAYMAGVAKAAGFAALIRVFFSAFPALIDAWRPLFYVSAVLTLLVGSVLAIVQRDVKRMLAYSSISHAGFMLLGVQSGTIQGREGVLVYLLSYLFVVLGSFTIVSMVGGQRDSAHSLADYQGLARRRPVLAACFTLFLLAQAGVPGTSGFIAKFGVILASTDAEAYPLAVIAMLSAAIAAFFYLRLALVMYGGSSSMTPTTSHDDGVIPLDELADGEARREGKSRLVIGLPQAIVLAASVTVTIAVGVFPALAFNLAQSATLMLR
jgi:NADH-quinone oxidoreductase subunit N